MNSKHIKNSKVTTMKIGTHEIKIIKANNLYELDREVHNVDNYISDWHLLTNIVEFEDTINNTTRYMITLIKQLI